MNAAPRPSLRLEIALAIPLRDREVLLRPRPEGGSLSGAWEFPGGKIEDREVPVEAAARELREETGLTGTRWEALAVHAHDYPDRRVRLHAFLVQDPEGRLLPDAGWVWVPLAHLPHLSLPAANGPIVRALSSRLR